jgi:hypothetical protein
MIQKHSYYSLNTAIPRSNISLADQKRISAHLRLLNRCGLSVLLLALAACATPQTGHKSDADNANAEARSKTETDFTDALTTPLSDFNLIRTEIMPILLAAAKAPYRSPDDKTCKGLEAEVNALDRSLGPDLDAAGAADEISLLEQGSNEVGNAAMGALRGAAEGLIPFRSWVRRLTGAEQHSKDVAAAVAAGIVRRAYLKGLGQAGGCPVPAAPRV